MLSIAAVRGFLASAPIGLPPDVDPNIDMRVLAFAIGVSVATALIFGLVAAGPAFRVQLTSALLGGGRTATSGNTRMREALLFLETSDIIFAVDSVPAIFAISREPLIVFTSNVFAILGLRAMYFLLAGAIERFHLLKYALATILIFVGLKMVWLNDAFGGKFPIEWSLGIIATLLTAAVVASWLKPPTPAPAVSTRASHASSLANSSK